MSQITPLETDIAPRALGPYSQAVAVGEFIFCSGQIAVDPVTQNLIAGGIIEQTRQVLENLRAVLEAGGSGLGHVVKCEIFLSNMDDFQIMNEVYAEYFSLPFPARVTVEVSKLPKSALVEISCIAYAASHNK